MARPATLTELQVITEPLGGSPLSLVAQSGDVPEDWYTRRPRTSAEWRDHSTRIAMSFRDGAWASGLAPAIEASGAAASRLSRTVEANGVVVTTGQQPGLFGGPIYTFSKAISALALADEIEERTGVRVAPLFWAATDDADFEEARWTAVAVPGRLERLEVRDAPPVGTPMAATPLGDVTGELDRLERASGSAAFADAIAAARSAYRRDATVGNAYVALLRALLEPLGVAVLDASHAAVRGQAAAVLRHALVGAADIAASLRKRGDDLRRAGFEPQVTDTPDLSLVFSLRDGVKQRVPLHDAAALARSAGPDSLSPNVLLRPVVERAVLPTIAYVGGPAELTYFAQVSAVADAIGAARPMAVPRWSCTIIEPHVQRILDRLHIDYSELADPNAVESRLSREAVPDSVANALRNVREAIDRATSALSTDADAARLLPTEAVVGAKASLMHRLQRLERRYVAAVKRREEALMRDLGTLRAHLFPTGKRQERVLNFLPLLARQGPQLWSAMREAAGAHAQALVGGGRP